MINIRKSNENDLDTLVDLWYRASIKAHDFIHEKYWDSQRCDMKEKYLPMADTVVIENHEKLVGFISMVGDYLAAIFIDNESQGKGYGKRLLDYIKEDKQCIQLKVYKKNEASCRFYLKNNFKIIEETMDEATGEKEYLMAWNK